MKGILLLLKKLRFIYIYNILLTEMLGCASRATHISEGSARSSQGGLSFLRDPYVMAPLKHRRVYHPL